AKRAWARADPKDLAVYNQAQRDAKVLEVLEYKDGLAQVISLLAFPPGVGSHPYTARGFGRKDGKWKNLGESRLPSLAAARDRFDRTKDHLWAYYQKMTADTYKAVSPDVRRRSVARKIADFPDKVDLSTPESALAAFHRASARQDAKGVCDLSWVPISPESARRTWARADPKDLAVYNQAKRDAKVLEVLEYKDGLAQVISLLAFPPGVGRHPYTARTFGRKDGQWKNLGEDRLPSLEAARDNFNRKKDRIRAHYLRLTGAARPGPEDLKQVKELARSLLEKIRDADYDHFLDDYRKGWAEGRWKQFPGIPYTVYTDYPGFVRWCCVKFKANPISEIHLGEPVVDKLGRPVVPYAVLLKRDNVKLRGSLPFQRDPRRDPPWSPLEGIDWHLRYGNGPGSEHTATALLRVRARSADLVAAKGAGDVAKIADRYRNTLAALIRTRSVAADTVRDKRVRNTEWYRRHRDDPVGSLMSEVKVEAVSNTDLIQLLLRGDHPGQTADIVNAFAEAVVGYFREQDRRALGPQEARLRDELRQLRTRLAAARDQITAVRGDSSLAAMRDTLGPVQLEVQTLTAKMIEARL
ncbi:MAG: hypothetical protein ACYS5V_17030, partial [Planctomycetota bacterium]